MREKNIKQLLAGMLAVLLTIAGVAIQPNKVQAEDNAVVTYVEVQDYNSFTTLIQNHTAPTKEGYLFAGWYKVGGNSRIAIKAADEVTETDTIVAKYVRADMSGVGCQLNLAAENSTTRAMRIVSIVDSTHYSKVGFNVYGREDGEGVRDEWMMYEHNSERQAVSTKVYSGLCVYKNETECDVRTPAQVFGSDAEGFKFTTMLLSGIPQADYSTIIAIKPYWITLDGTYVEGMGEFNRVNDFAEGIVNISVNLKQATTIAAGLLEISYDKSSFRYEGADYGRVFEEMEIQELTAGTIKCVGCVTDATKNSDYANEVYVNLRFKKTDSNSLAAGSASFTVTVPDNGFCSSEEKFVHVSAPSVKY